MRLRPILTCAAAGALIAGTALVAAPFASAGAPIIWHQAVAVPSASSPCPVTTDAEKAKGWTGWINSWAQWPNDGNGGNVCTRSITWAYEADAAGMTFPSAGCVRLTHSYIDFGGGWSLPTAPAFVDAGCLEYDVYVFADDLVYAPPGFDADSLCMAAFGSHAAAQPWDDNVYVCS